MIGRDCRCPGCGTCDAASEVERLRARVRSVDHSTAYEGKAFSDNESSQEDLAIVASERDAARAESDELRRERDQLLARLRAVYPWIGVTPFVPAAIAHLSLERDLARDSIEEISADIRRRGW